MGEMGERRAGSMGMNKASERTTMALRTLGVLEAVKGALALAAAGGLVSLRHTDLHEATEVFLRHHGFDPGQHYTRLFIDSVARASNHNLGQIAAFALCYGLIRLVEGYGLWHGKHWAEWFAALSAGLYLPFEIRHFAHRPSFFSAGVILLNIALVIYLGRLLVARRASGHAPG